MECPHCGAANSLMSDRCFHCGRDLSAAPPGPDTGSAGPATRTNVGHAATSAARLYLFVGIGLSVVSGVFLALTYVGIAPILPAGTVAPAIAYAPAAIAVALLGVVLFVVRRRVPGRPPGLSVEEYWSNPEMGGKVASIWFLLEGGGIIAGVGYFVTGEPTSAIAMGLMIAAYWLCGPDRLTGP